jgi:hypothetical protein
MIVLAIRTLIICIFIIIIIKNESKFIPRYRYPAIEYFILSCMTVTSLFISTTIFCKFYQENTDLKLWIMWFVLIVLSDIGTVYSLGGWIIRIREVRRGHFINERPSGKRK